MIMLVGIQYALIGQAALAVSQGSSALARYATNHLPPAAGSLGGTSGNGTVSTLPAAAQQLLSQSILTNGGNDLTVTVASYQGTTTTPTDAKRPVKFADTCVVTLTYTTTSKLALPNPFLGLVTFPGTVSASATQMYE